MPENKVETSTINESTKLSVEDLPIQENPSASILSSGSPSLTNEEKKSNEEKPEVLLVKI